MSTDTDKDRIAELEQRVSELERKYEAPQVDDLTADGAAAQEAHEAAVSAFQTEQRDGMNVSLNSAMTPQETEAMLRTLEQAEQQDAKGEAEHG